MWHSLPHSVPAAAVVSKGHQGAGNKVHGQGHLRGISCSKNQGAEAGRGKAGAGAAAHSMLGKKVPLSQEPGKENIARSNQLEDSYQFV